MTQQSSQADDADPSLGEVLDFMRLVWAVDTGLKSLSGEVESIFGMSGPQRLVLRVLAKYAPLSAGELSEMLEMTRTTVNAHLRFLEEAGCLQRGTDPEDRRRTLISLTKRGAKLSEAYASTVEAAVRRVLSKVTGRTIDSAKLVLSTLAEELSDTGLRPRTAHARSKA